MLELISCSETSNAAYGYSRLRNWQRAAEGYISGLCVLLLVNPAFSQSCGSGCKVPSSEVTSVNRNTGPSVGFQATISDPAGDNWTGYYVWEVDPPGPLTNSNTCYWAGNPDNLPEMPSIAFIAQITGQSYWTVETGNVYGIDFVGFTPQTLVDIVKLHPASVTLPCTYSVKQEMEIECNDSTKWEYKLNQQTFTANVNNWYQSCRDGVCASGVWQ